MISSSKELKIRSHWGRMLRNRSPRKLNLNQNSLSTAPVGKLARLESLLLRSNHFRAVPLELCELPNLRCNAASLGKVSTGCLTCGTMASYLFHPVTCRISRLSAGMSSKRQSRTLRRKVFGRIWQCTCFLPALGSPIAQLEACQSGFPTCLRIAGRSWLTGTSCQPCRSHGTCQMSRQGLRSLGSYGVRSLQTVDWTDRATGAPKSSLIETMGPQPLAFQRASDTNDCGLLALVFFRLFWVRFDPPRVVSLRKNQLTALPKSFPESRSLRLRIHHTSVQHTFTCISHQ